MREAHHHEPDSSGFAFTRRTVLRSSAALGMASSMAGCNLSDDDTTSTEPPPVDPMSGLIDDGLEILDTGFVDGDDVWLDLWDDDTTELPTPSVDDALSKTYFRVRVRNTLEESIGVVTLTLEVFDEDLDFLGIQSATITSLLSKEVFEGHVPYIHGDPSIYEEDVAAAYVLRADRSTRSVGQATIDGLEIEDHCLTNEQVRGTLSNTGDEPVGRCRVLARFYDEAGRVLGTGSDTVTDIDGNATAEYEVDADAVVEHDATRIDDYSVSVGDYAGETLAVR